MRMVAALEIQRNRGMRALKDNVKRWGDYWTPVAKTYIID
jgi:hypothetical protein